MKQNECEDQRWVLTTITMHFIKLKATELNWCQLTRTKFGDRAFPVAGPPVRNSVPESVRSTKTLPNLKCNLKTHLLNTAFN